MPAHYTIGGCQVHFPHQAYGVQLSFMNKVIAALEGGHNALLEAPTGSGKTLSLLCSALAWQVREKQRIEEGLATEKAADKEALDAAAAEDPIADACGGSGGKCGGGGGGTCGSGSSGESPEWKDKTAPSAGKGSISPGDGGFMPVGEGGEEQAEAPRRKKAPKIFYATRTHSQIAQVVKELKRSEYKPRMAVLGSRKHYCINQHATKQSSIDEACEELLKESQCQYFKGVHSFANSGHAYRLHDIEDLKGFGKSHKACPYYTARKWAEDAEVIFAPYSYLIDPVIRRALTVDVDGSMLIFDEAHNIEDVCREAGSTEVDLDTMREVVMAFRKAFELNGKPEVYGPLASCADSVVTWMADKERVAIAHQQHQRQQGGGRGGRGGGAGRSQDPYERLFPANQMMGELTACGLGPDHMDPLWEAYQAAREEEEAMNQDGGPGGGSGGKPKDGKENQGQAAGAPPPMCNAVRVGALALGVMSRLIQVVRMLHQVSDDGARDYRLVVTRLYEQDPAQNMGRYRAKGRAGEEDDANDANLPGFTFKMCLWSMNPAVAFKPVAESAHSVVLTSGTLAPLEGFASELGTPFAITLEAPHVVDMRRQVWAGVVGAGPGGTSLVATYKNTGEPAFQDAVGRVVLDASASIPDGLLVFLPSYSLLDRLMLRWKTTGALKQLGKLKKVVQEPRGGGQDALKKTMTEYYGAIQGGGGAVFFAVCRGKVSEGLDFADGNARGVIIVGIPFPHARDLKVNEKKVFNDRGQRQLGLVSGDTWYSQQAFRALNQALGRCIRHRLDWGAILMVDDRFRQPRNQKMLSRWVRGALTVHPTFDAGMASMRGFFQAIQANPPGPPAGAAKPASGSGDADLAAAVAAAVAAAGLLPQQQQHKGKEGEVMVGRGVEGALGGISQYMIRGSVAGAGGAMGVHDVWQGKPLGQARMGQVQQGGQHDAAAAAALARWAPHPGAAVPAGQAGGFVLPAEQPHQQWATAVKQEQQQQQPWPAVKQEQQQQQPWPAVKQEQQQQQVHPSGPAAPAQQPWPPMKQEQQQWPGVKQEQQQWPAVKQEQGPQQQWQAGPAAQQPPYQQYPQQQYPQQQLHPQQQHATTLPGVQDPSRHQPAPGFEARPHSAEQPAPPACDAAALAAALRRAPIGQWVQADLTDTLAFLRTQGFTDTSVPAGYSSLAAVAVDGVKDAFDAAKEYLGRQGSLLTLAEEWCCMLPRGLQAALAAGPAAMPADKPRDPVALAFGEQRLALGSDPAVLVAALDEAYRAPLEALRGSPFGSPPLLAPGAELQYDRAAAVAGGPPSPTWQQRGQQLAAWQQPSTGSGSTGTAGGGGAAGAVSPDGFQAQGGPVDQAATPLMNWAQQQQQAPHLGQQQQMQAQGQQGPSSAWQHQAPPVAGDSWQQPHGGLPLPQQQRPGSGPLAYQPHGRPQQQQQQHWQQQNQAPQPLQGYRQQQQHWQQPTGRPSGAVGQPAGPQPMGYASSNQQQAPQSWQPQQQQRRWQSYQAAGPQPPPAPAGWAPQRGQQAHWQQEGPAGHMQGPPPQQQQAPLAAHPAPQQVPHKRDASAAGSGAEQEQAKKRYMRSKNAEAAARSRAAATGGGAPAAALDAAQRAAMANEMTADLEEDNSSSSSDFQ